MQKRRILIVDNNDDLRAILEDALGLLGHEAVLTEDAQTVDQSNGPPNAPQISQPHRRHLLTPVFSNATEPVIVKAFKMVAANYLRSPYNKDELREIVEQTLSYKLRYVDDPS